MNQSTEKEIGAKFKDVIVGVLNNLKEKENSETFISLKEIVECLKEAILESFDPSVSPQKRQNFQDTWKQRIISTGNSIGIIIDKTKIPSWKFLDDASINMDLDSGSSEIESFSSSSSSSVGSSSDEFLSEAEKFYIKKSFEKLDSNKFWILESSHGQSLDEKVMDFALNKCIYEHLSHSLILDVSDDYWKDVFTPEEMVEINSDQHGKPLLRDLPDDVQHFLDDIRNTENVIEAFRLVKNKDIDIEQETDLMWIYKAITDSAWHFINNSSRHWFTESDALYRSYGFLLDLYDGSDIKPIGGDFLSNSSQGQNFDDIEELARKESTPIVDVIFSSGSDDLGYCKVVHHDYQTKKFKDTKFKLLKLMKDTIVNIDRKYVHCTNNVQVVGYIISGDKISMYIMDNPKGYVCRVRTTNELSYPSNKNAFGIRMATLLELAFRVKMIMEDTLNIMLIFEKNDYYHMHEKLV